MSRIFHLRAKTAEGIGGKDYYKEFVCISGFSEQDVNEKLFRKRVDFCLKYKVQLDDIEVTDVTNETE